MRIRVEVGRKLAEREVGFFAVPLGAAVHKYNLHGLAAVVDPKPAAPVPVKLPTPFARIYEDGHWLVDREHSGTYNRQQLFGGVEVWTVAQVEALVGNAPPEADPLAKKRRTC